jgi:hypothetical protein
MSAIFAVLFMAVLIAGWWFLQFRISAGACGLRLGSPSAPQGWLFCSRWLARLATHSAGKNVSRAAGGPDR